MGEVILLQHGHLRGGVPDSQLVAEQLGQAPGRADELAANAVGRGQVLQTDGGGRPKQAALGPAGLADDLQQRRGCVEALAGWTGSKGGDGLGHGEGSDRVVGIRDRAGGAGRTVGGIKALCGAKWGGLTNNCGRFGGITLQPFPSDVAAGSPAGGHKAAGWAAREDAVADPGCADGGRLSRDPRQEITAWPPVGEGRSWKRRKVVILGRFAVNWLDAPDSGAR